jgi:hypothetical protein
VGVLGGADRGEVLATPAEIDRAGRGSSIPLFVDPTSGNGPLCRVDHAGALIAEDEVIVRSVGEAFVSIHSCPSRIRGATYGADMHLLVNHGGTHAILFGPGDVRLAHSADEFVLIEELATATRVLALTALRFCGTLTDGETGT